MAKYEMYVGSFDKTEKSALLRGTFDSADGSMTLTERLDIPAPAYLSWKQDQKTLYAALETFELDGVYGGGIASVDVTGETMKLVDKQYTHGKGPAHILIEQDWALLAMYAEGAITQFKLGENGKIEPADQIVHHIGKGANPDRQEMAHAHFAATTPDGKYLAVVDLGMDQIFMYPFCKETGITLSPKRIAAPAGYGPRHLVFSVDGAKMYVLTELAEHVLVYSYADGQARLIQDISALPEDFEGESSGAAIRLSPNGKTLVVSNRGHESLTFFTIQEDGTLMKEGYAATGAHPREFVFTPDGGHILCANMNDETIDCFLYSDDLSLPFSQRVEKLEDKQIYGGSLPCAIVFGKEIN